MGGEDPASRGQSPFCVSVSSGQALDPADGGWWEGTMEVVW